jgi:hypothetical protein
VRTLLKGPEVDAPVGPVHQKQGQTTLCRTQVVTATQFRTATLESLLYDGIEVEIEVGCGCSLIGHYFLPFACLPVAACFRSNAFWLSNELFALRFAFTLGGGSSGILSGAKSLDSSFW